MSKEDAQSPPTPAVVVRDESDGFLHQQYGAVHAGGARGWRRTRLPSEQVLAAPVAVERR